MRTAKLGIGYFSLTQKGNFSIALPGKSKFYLDSLHYHFLSSHTVSLETGISLSFSIVLPIGY
jgi:hypothetical protein